MSGLIWLYFAHQRLALTPWLDLQYIIPSHFSEILHFTILKYLQSTHTITYGKM